MKETKSKTSPKGGGRGCLGKDGKYSIENCKGNMINQGIGSLTGQGTSVIIKQ